MASENKFHHQLTCGPKWAIAHCRDFLNHIRQQGYSTWSFQQYRRNVAIFCKEMVQRKFRKSDIQSPLIKTLIEEVLQSLPRKTRSHARFSLEQFIDYLARAGAINLRPPPPKEPTAWERLEEEYTSYLLHQRGMSQGTINHCRRYMRYFLSFRFGETLGDLNAITPEDIMDYFRRSRTKPNRIKPVPSPLRNLFKFLFWSGKTRRNLATSIPRIPKPPPNLLPRSLGPEEILRVLNTISRLTAIGRRNYAMLLLMARLGLRSTEVLAIQLEDIDWRSGEILIRGKGKRHDRMPLPSDVGEAIVDYIQNGRAGTSRTLFVTRRAPCLPFNNHQIVGTVLHQALKKAGLNPPQKYVGSHLLRHSLAMDMLRKGVSLPEIGDVLRHRSKSTTTLYAKYDIDALRSIAQPWPVQGGAR